MDKTQQKDLEYFGSKENIERVHVHAGIEKKNFQNTYLHNLNGKNKTKMTTAISLGAMCMEYHISKDELLGAIAFVITKRNLDGIS